ncbi:hypothetical protein G6F43_004593 [Rhizopus delemar]|nr:hypothetical protein G6F43_004593 [Rhizopus delemar]
MEVLKSDFEKILPVIKEALLEADFISVDAEFTGLTPPNIQMFQTDDLTQRYNKIKSCVQEFTIIQYGVCAFKRDKETGDFIAKPFNFYIFGNDSTDIHSRRVFTSTASSLAFLRSNKFDFNKLIDEGIPFYNFTEEGSFNSTQSGTSMLNRRTYIKESSLTTNGKNFLDNARTAIATWLQGNTEKPLVVQTNSHFYKKLITQEVLEKHNGYVQVAPRDSKHVQLVRLKEEEKRQREAKVSSPTLNFRAVIEAIKDAKCPVVAHNGALDIFHTVDQFWQYLPETIEECKDVVNSMWDYIVDTKYLAEYHPLLKGCFNTTVLGSLYNTVFDELKEAGQEITMAPGFERYTGEGNNTEHEAGYDAYMTGVIYLAFMMFIREQEPQAKESPQQVLGKRKHKEEEVEEEEEEKEKEEEEEEEGEIDDDDDDDDDDEIEKTFLSKSLLPYYGRVFLMRSDIPYINFKGEEEIQIQSYPHKFYLHNIPTGMTHTGIEKLYPTIQPAAVSWVNQNNAWLILKDESKIPLAKLGLLGITTIQSFLPGASREVEGRAYGITKEASNMELITYEKWAELYGPKKTVNYNNLASALAAATQDNNGENHIPSGGPSFDEIELPSLPVNAIASKKRQRDEEDSSSKKSTKAQKTN